MLPQGHNKGARSSWKTNNDDSPQNIDHKNYCKVSRSNRMQKSLIPLQNSKNDNEKDGDDDNKTKKNMIQLPKEITDKVDELGQKIIGVLPKTLVETLETIWKKFVEIFPSLRLAFFSFVSGCIIMLGAILAPVYTSVENLSEPVTLFETILADLDAGYVDPVDTKKLFETGVSAMLRSLDPYTEFEAKEEAQTLSEGIAGRYGGVGLVISGATPKDVAMLQKATTPPSSSEQTPTESKLLPKDAIEDSLQLQDGDDDVSTTNGNSLMLEDEEEDDDDELFVGMSKKDRLRALEKAKNRGIRVVDAFEGYAFDYGLRVGDRIKQVDDVMVSSKTTVEDVRNVLRGEPGTLVTIQFEREGVDGLQSVTMPRRIVQLRDVKLAKLVGNPKDGIGYISLTGFAQNAGREVRQAMLALDRAAEEASNGEHTLKGLILDLRGNPGGLLTSAVDVSSLLVPNGSEIVSARGRGFPGVTYKSRVDPILKSDTKLAVLVNRGTASAAEIVSGAVQDLDVGVIVGADRTFGKGLVQNVEDLPFNTALKFTVAKYYTPSGRCIQGVTYKEGGGLKEEDGRFRSKSVAEKDRQKFYTRLGRIVKDGGGVEADFKVEAPKASALEVTLLRSDILGEFAAQWSRNNQLGYHSFEVDDNMYREFQDFVEKKRQAGDIKIDALYSGALQDLKRQLKQSGYKGSEKEIQVLESTIIREIKSDFEKYKKDIKEDIATTILARYIPESMLLDRGLKADKQFEAAVQLLKNQNSFDKLLAKGGYNDRTVGGGGNAMNVASADVIDSRSTASSSSGPSGSLKSKR